VGLGARLDHTPNQLSGGQQQRVAIARALVTDPPLLLADEPTGNLDTRTSLEVLALLQTLNRDRGITIVLVTHERDIAACASRVVTMRDGRIVTDVRQAEPMNAAAQLAGLPHVDDTPPASMQLTEVGESTAARLGGPLPLSVYPMMLLGDLLGEGIAAAYIGLVLELRVLSSLWVGRVVGEVAKAFVGARWARRHLGRPPTSDQRARMALWYTLSVSCGAVFLVLGALLATPAQPAASSSLAEVWSAVMTASAHGPAVLAALVFGAMGCAVLLRYLLLTTLNPRR
jgi:putative ABC transport system ATP-binding protein